MTSIPRAALQSTCDEVESWMQRAAATLDWGTQIGVEAQEAARRFGTQVLDRLERLPTIANRIPAEGAWGRR